MRINPISFMSMILLVVFTLVLAVLTMVKSNQIDALEEGDPTMPTVRSISKIKKEINELEATIKAHSEAIALRQREIDRLDFGDVGTAAQPVKRHGTGQHGIYVTTDGKMLAGVSTPDTPELTADNKTLRLKESPWKVTADLVTSNSRRLENLKSKYESVEQQSNAPLDESIRKRQDELQTVLKKIGDGEAQFSHDKEELTKRLDELTSSKEKLEKAHRDVYSRNATKISQLEDQIRGLLELELRWVTDIEADGEILQAAGNQVIVNLGLKDKAFPGLLFEVATRSHGGYQRKGAIELIEVKDSISIGRITTQDDVKRNPIGKGDQIGNPVFDVLKPKVFHVAGEFKQYNKEDLEQFIRSTGGLISPVLGPGCDFLVAGDRSDREQDNARQYQILAMKEESLLKFVQRTFAPKTAAAR